MDERLMDLPARELIARLATGDPIPGGGSAAAVAGAMGAALVEMVVALTVGRPGAGDDDLTRIAISASSAREELMRLAEIDAVAYDAVIRARRMPRTTDDERAQRLERITAATRDATRAPLATAAVAADVFRQAERLAPIGNPHAISDVGVGGLLAATAVRGAALNVRINLPFLASDDPLQNEAAAEVDRLLAGLDEREQAVTAAVEARLG